MSSATSNRVTAPLTNVVAAIAWLAVAAALALGGAGLVGELTHPPGSPARAELTWQSDRQLAVRLDDASKRLQSISDNVDRMSTAAKAALAAISSADSVSLQTNLDRGDGAAALIAAGTRDLTDSLAGLPGDGSQANLQYSNATLVRRAAILAALDAASGLASQWAEVTARSLDAAKLITLLQDHDATVAKAASFGVLTQYSDAIATLQTALITLEDIDSLRAELVVGGQMTVLDAWLASHTTYDAALTSLYRALEASHGKITLNVQAAAIDEKRAREALPTDNRAIVVIIAQVAAGGLNQAVLAIEDARGRLDIALAAGTPS